MTGPAIRIGLLGGTFDPPHVGHLAAARYASERFSLDRVLLVTTHHPPHKPERPLSSGLHRYAMTVLATLPDPDLAASPIELIRGGTSYTIDTLRQARSESPESAIVFILGTDQFAELDTWREPRALVEEFGLIVIGRPGNGFRKAIDGLPSWVAEAARAGRIQEGAMPPVPVSSTEIRGRVAEGRSISGLVVNEVSQYIDRYALYRWGG